MVNWFRSKLTVYKFSIVDNGKSVTGESSMQPLDGEGDQEYLLRLILLDHPKK